MQLEEFIRANHDKTLRYDGGSTMYIYGMWRLSCRSYDGHIFEAVTVLAAPELMVACRFDIRKEAKEAAGQELTAIWRWINEEFLPCAERSVAARVLQGLEKNLEAGEKMELELEDFVSKCKLGIPFTKRHEETNS